jgi:hypothetical protein
MKGEKNRGTEHVSTATEGVPAIIGSGGALFHVVRCLPSGIVLSGVRTCS